MIPKILQVLSAIVRIRHSSATAPSPSPTHGRRATHEKLRIREAGDDGVEHRGPALRPADPQREWAESSGRERACRRLLVGLACRGLPQGAPRVIRPIGVDAPISRGTVSPLVFVPRGTPFRVGPRTLCPSIVERARRVDSGANSAVLPRVATCQEIAIDPNKSGRNEAGEHGFLDRAQCALYPCSIVSAYSHSRTYLRRIQRSWIYLLFVL